MKRAKLPFSLKQKRKVLVFIYMNSQIQNGYGRVSSYCVGGKKRLPLLRELLLG
jgi:hypothetical protein